MLVRSGWLERGAGWLERAEGRKVGDSARSLPDGCPPGPRYEWGRLLSPIDRHLRRRLAHPADRETPTCWYVGVKSQLASGRYRSAGLPEYGPHGIATE